MQDEENHGDDHDDVNETTGDMKHKEPAQPGDEQNDGKNEQHRELPPVAVLCTLCTQNDSLVFQGGRAFFLNASG
jgi:hypothetical protein